MMEGNEEAFGAYQSLAMLLEFLSQLENETEVKKKVIKGIQEKVEEYVKDDDQQFGNPTTGYLIETIKKSKELRRNIVKTDSTYKHYTKPFQDGDANKYTQLLIRNIFSLFGCLYYMYYECASECGTIEGSDWSENMCDGSGSGQDLKHWLKDETGKTGRMIERGFKDISLSEQTGTELFGEEEEDDSNGLLSYADGAQLQFALYYMLFLPEKWKRGQLGHAVLFLQEFCKMVKDGDFNGQYTEADGGEEFESACQTVTRSIQNLIQSKTIVPVAVTSDLNYKDLIDEEHFWDYIKWLKKNIDQLIVSLKDMEGDVDKWNKNALKASSTFGPYPWGFTFYDGWDSKKEELQQKLKTQLSELTKALQTLKDALKSISEAKNTSQKADEESSNFTKSIIATNSTDSTASAASTLGGVAAGVGAAAATAGVAAYSGVLGPVAEGIGRFFKGLFL